jgi:hypothetical protein
LASGTELRVFSDKHLDASSWTDIKTDVKNILDGNLNGTAAAYKAKGKAQIILNHISSDYHPLGADASSSSMLDNVKTGSRPIAWERLRLSGSRPLRWPREHRTDRGHTPPADAAMA